MTHSYLETMRVKCLLLVSFLLLEFITAFPTDDWIPVENVEYDSWTLEEIMKNLKNGQFLKNTFNRAQRDFDFLGSRGKRGATDFLGTRGKKMSEIFIGSRGKKSDFDFLGSRGKKAADATDFYGVRGKKDFEEFLKRIMERRSDVFTAVRG